MDGVKSDVKAIEGSSIRSWRYYDSLLRVFGLLFTLVAAVVVGVDNESKTITISFIKGLPPFPFHATAKWQYVSAFKYFLVSNAIACSYAAVSLVYSMATQGCNKTDNPSKLDHLALTVSDLIVMGLLLSANGAAAAIGVIGQHGNTHLQWRQVCNFFEGYCHHFAASFALSLIGSFIFLCLVVVSILNLYRSRK